MLTGSALGAAIETARKKKGITKKDLAAHFGVKPPSVQDWVKRGTIDKEKLPALWAFFAEVVGLDHWGLETSAVSPSSPPHLPTLLQALEVLGIELAKAPPDMREALATNLGGWARDGGRGPWQGIVAGLLTTPPAKRQRGP